MKTYLFFHSCHTTINILLSWRLPFRPYISAEASHASAWHITTGFRTELNPRIVPRLNTLDFSFPSCIIWYYWIRITVRYSCCFVFDRRPFYSQPWHGLSPFHVICNGFLMPVCQMSWKWLQISQALLLPNPCQFIIIHAIRLHVTSVAELSPLIV